MNTSRISSAKYVNIVLIAVACVIFCTPHAHAQSGLLGISGAISIGTSPSYPGPGDSVHLTAESSAIDLSSASLVWYANGKVIAQGSGVVSADVTAGALGTETDVEVDALAADGTSASAQATLIPTQIDLLVDSDSYTPPFYRGRALPSAGTDLMLQAVPYFKRPDGSMVASSDITYTWKRDNEVMASVSGRGRSSVVIDSPPLFGTDTISVVARSSDGTLAGNASVSIPSVEPALALYEDHPLFGILYGQALGASTFIPESEMTFAAVPYFAQAQSANDAGMDFAWRVNDTAITPSTANPGEITIDSANSNGSALVSLELTRPSNFYMDARGSWNITFSGGAGAQAQSATFGQ